MADGMIYKAISAVMDDVDVVGKESTNKQQGYKFRGIDAVMNALNPALIKNKVFVIPEVLEQRREERATNKGGLLIYSICKIKYTFFAEDGSSVSATVIGEGMDSGDKATNKAMSSAFKYACFQVFCIPTEELMEEPDKDSKEPAAKKNSPEFATVEQMHRLDELIAGYSGLCEDCRPDNVWKTLQERYCFMDKGKLSVELADKLIYQVKTWYEKKKAG